MYTLHTGSRKDREGKRRMTKYVDEANRDLRRLQD